jgi:ABC-type transport system substrate-binding protein
MSDQVQWHEGDALGIDVDAVGETFIVEVDGVDFTAADVEWALRAAFPATFAEEGTTVRVTSGGRNTNGNT